MIKFTEQELENACNETNEQYMKGFRDGLEWARALATEQFQLVDENNEAIVTSEENEEAMNAAAFKSFFDMEC